MNSFNRDNLNQIKHIFEERTGVKLAARKSLRRPVYVGAALAVIACCFTITGYAMGMFSSLSGDDLSLNATYEGEGVVSIFVENKSDKELNFQPSLKLMLWNSGEEIPPTSDRVVFEGTRIAARSSGTSWVISPP